MSNKKSGEFLSESGESFEIVNDADHEKMAREIEEREDAILADLPCDGHRDGMHHKDALECKRWMAERVKERIGLETGAWAVFCDTCGGGPWDNDIDFVKRAQEGGWRHAGCGGKFVARKVEQ